MEDDRPDLPGTPPAPAATRPDDAAQRRANAVEAYARGHEGLVEENEIDALDYLLGNHAPAEFDVPIEFDTPVGRATLTFTVRAQDGAAIRKIEDSHRNETTGELDMEAANAEIVVKATRCVRGLSAREVTLDSSEFLTVTANKRDPETGEVTPTQIPLASPVEAVRVRFRTQYGLIMGLAEQIRGISGYDRSRIGQARRRLVAASGNS